MTDQKKEESVEKDNELFLEIMDGLKETRHEIRYLDPRDLKEWEIHLREDNQDEVEVLAQRMREEGFRPEFPVTIDMSTMEVISGTLRLQAALKAEIGAIPCVCYDKLEQTERILLASDDGLKRAQKSPMAVVRQLDILHNQAGFSYRTIERLLGISRAVIHRKLLVVGMPPSIQRLYAAKMIGDMDVERFAKDVKPEHMDAVAEKLRDRQAKADAKGGGVIQKKPSIKIAKLDKDLVLEAYKTAASQPDVLSGKQALVIPAVDFKATERHQAAEKFLSDIDQVGKALQKANFRFYEDPSEELKLLKTHYDLTREAIRVRSARIGVEPIVLSKDEELEIITERYASSSREIQKPAGVAAAWSSDELGPSGSIPPETPPEPDSPPDTVFDLESLSAKGLIEYGYSPDEAESLLEEMAQVPSMPEAVASASEALEEDEEPDTTEIEDETKEQPVHYVDVSPERLSKVMGRIMENKHRCPAPARAERKGEAE